MNGTSSSNAFESSAIRPIVSRSNTPSAASGASYIRYDTSSEPKSSR